jgi:putative hydrolase of HD superfamily
VRDLTGTKTNQDRASGLLALARHVARLKRVRRTGWLDRGVDPSDVESVADHSLGVALLAWAAALERSSDGASIDPERVLKLAVLHDLAEAETGDVPPYDPTSVPKEEDAAARRAFLERRHYRDAARQAAKRTAEDAAIGRLLEALSPSLRRELGELWAELQIGTSAEARFVKQTDRLETFLQSLAYHSELPGLPVDSFRREVIESIDDPLLAAVRDAVLGDVSA